MRLLLPLSLPLSLLSACAVPDVTAPTNEPRALEGIAEEGTTALLAIDSTGLAFRVAPAADRSFHLDLNTTHPIHLFVLKGDAVQYLRFAQKIGGAPTATSIPNHNGTVRLASVASDCDPVADLGCDADGDGTSDSAEPENNPLNDDHIDTDDDGESDAADDDDDGDGVNDDADDDANGDGENDDDQDQDTDNDEIGRAHV